MSLYQVLAPDLKGSLEFHVFFLFHMCQQLTVETIISHLSEPLLSFKCLWKVGDFMPNLSRVQQILYGISKSRITVIMLCQHFDQHLLPACEVVLSQLMPKSLKQTLLLIRTGDVDVPHILQDIPCIDTANNSWWKLFLHKLIFPGLSFEYLIFMCN